MEFRVGSGRVLQILSSDLWTMENEHSSEHVLYRACVLPPLLLASLLLSHHSPDMSIQWRPHLSGGFELIVPRVLLRFPIFTFQASLRGRREWSLGPDVYKRATDMDDPLGDHLSIREHKCRSDENRGEESELLAY